MSTVMYLLDYFLKFNLVKKSICQQIKFTVPAGEGTIMKSFISLSTSTIHLQP